MERTLHDWLQTLSEDLRQKVWMIASPSKLGTVYPSLSQALLWGTCWIAVNEEDGYKWKLVYGFVKHMEDSK